MLMEVVPMLHREPSVLENNIFDADRNATQSMRRVIMRNPLPSGDWLRIRNRLTCLQLQM